MKKLLQLMILIMPLSVQAEYHNGHQMLEFCSAAQVEPPKKPKSKKKQDELSAVTCNKYLAGVSDLNESAGMPFNRTGLFFCPEAGVTMKTMTSVYVRYLQAHPEFLEANAALLAINAFKDEYPCEYKNLLDR